MWHARDRGSQVWRGRANACYLDCQEVTNGRARAAVLNKANKIPKPAGSMSNNSTMKRASLIGTFRGGSPSQRPRAFNVALII
jgi:hypothetical protein